jgi:hypothetical protein
LSSAAGPQVWSDSRLRASVRHPDHKLQGDIMAIRVGVNGFGRVGRNFFRAVDAQHAGGQCGANVHRGRAGY